MKDFKKALHFFSFFKKKTNAFLGLCRRARSPKVHRQQDVVYVVNRRRTMRLGFRLPRMASMPKTDRTRRAKVRGCQGWHLRRDPTAHDVQGFAAVRMTSWLRTREPEGTQLAEGHLGCGRAQTPPRILRPAAGAKSSHAKIRYRNKLCRLREPFCCSPDYYFVYYPINHGL